MLAAGLVLLAAAVPRWLIPLFYKLTPLDDPLLRERILALAARMGVRAAAVVVADFSRKGRTANAAVVGLGRTRRILVSDTLLREFPADEVEVVLAHELGHHARRHVPQGLVAPEPPARRRPVGCRPGAPRERRTARASPARETPPVFRCSSWS